MVIIEEVMNDSQISDITNDTLKNSDQDKRLDRYMKWTTVTELVGIVFFNTLVLVLLTLTKKKSRMGFYVQNLALGDLLVGFIYLLPEIIVYHFHVGWNGPSCYLFYSLRMFPVYASTFAILILTIDRLYVVIRPMKSATYGHKAKVMSLVFPWVLSALLTTPYWSLVTYKNGNCYFDIKDLGLKVMLLYDISVNVVIPVVIIGTCYTLIFITIQRRQGHNILQESNPAQYHQQNSPSKESLLSSRSDIFTKAKIKTIKILLVVVAAYALCWTPVCIATILQAWNIISHGPVYLVLYSLAPLNSLVNPVVFLFFNSKTFHFGWSIRRKSLNLSGTTSYQMQSSRLKFTASEKIKNDLYNR